MINFKKILFVIVPGAMLIFLLFTSIYSEEIASMYKVGDQEDIVYENMVLKDCPPDLDESKPYREVMQYIDGIFHKWVIYDLEGNREFCIVLKKPKYRRLDREEALELLEASRRWDKREPDPDKGDTLDPSDPILDVPPIDPLEENNDKAANGGGLQGSELEHEDKCEPELYYYELVDCPPGLDETKPSREVIQYIDGVLYKWTEYELKDSERICIILKKPEYRELSAEEALELLESSGKWEKREPDPDKGYTLDPSDPTLDVPPIDPLEENND